MESVSAGGPHEHFLAWRRRGEAKKAQFRFFYPSDFACGWMFTIHLTQDVKLTIRAPEMRGSYIHAESRPVAAHQDRLDEPRIGFYVESEALSALRFRQPGLLAVPLGKDRLVGSGSPLAARARRKGVPPHCVLPNVRRVRTRSWLFWRFKSAIHGCNLKIEPSRVLLDGRRD